MTPAQATLQLAALNVVRAEFNDVIVPSSGRIVAAFTALASSPERTSGILAYNVISAQFKAWGAEITAGIAATKAQIPNDPPPPPPPPPPPTVELGAKNGNSGKWYPGNGGPSAAFHAASAGDTILVAPGIYTPFSTGVPRAITVKSIVGGQKYTFDCAGNAWRMIEMAPQVSLTLEDAIVRRNKQLDAIEAGIWPTYGPFDLILRRCILHDLNNGIMIGEQKEATVLIEDSEIYDCGDNGGLSHNIYIGTVKSFIMRRCYSHMKKRRGDPGVPNWDISWGHLVKSRAKVTLIEDCRLTMEDSEANRCIDTPNGGDVTIRRNIIEYWTKQNGGAGQVMSFGVEEDLNFKANHPLHRLIFEDNTVVNRGGGPATVFWVLSTPPSEYSVKNNIFAGANMPGVKGDQKWAIPLTAASGNRLVSLEAFVDLANYDWRLKPGTIPLPPPPPPSNKTPVGSLDVIDAGFAHGWAIDPDFTSTSVEVYLYIDGAAGTGIELAHFPTDVLRMDINSLYGTGGNHGFAFQIPVKYRDNVAHSLHVYGRDVNDATGFSLLGTKSFTLSSVVLPPPPPPPPSDTIIQWSPPTGADGTVPASAWAALPLNTVVEWMGTALEAQLSPPYGCDEPGWYDPGVSKIHDHYAGYGGCAFDESTGKFYHFNGGHAGSANNVMTCFDASKGKHSIVIPPTHPKYWPPGYDTSGGFGAAYYPQRPGEEREHFHFPSGETTPGDDKPCSTHVFSGIVHIPGIEEVLIARGGWFHAMLKEKQWRKGPQVAVENRLGFTKRGYGISYQAHYLPSTGLVYMTSEGSQMQQVGGYFFVVKYDPVARKEVGVIEWDCGSGASSACVDEKGWYWYFQGLASHEVSTVDLPGSKAIRPRTPYGGRRPGYPLYNDNPVQYIPELGKILMWVTKGGFEAAPGELLQFDRQTLTFSAFPYIGKSPPVTPEFNNKMRWWPKHKVLMFQLATAKNCHLIRLA